MKQKSGPGKAPAEQVLKDIRRQTRRHYSAEEKIRIVLEGLRGEENISEPEGAKGTGGIAVKALGIDLSGAFGDTAPGCRPEMTR